MSEFCVLIVTVPEGVSGLDAAQFASTTSRDVIAKCKGCVRHMTGPIEAGGINSLTLGTMGDMQEGDTYVLRFPGTDTANLWFERNKHSLVGATVTFIDPAM